MKMTNRSRALSTTIIIASIYVMILLTGCTGMGSSSTEKTFNVGTDGLVLVFSKSNPTSVFETEEFGTSLFIKNVGSTTVTQNNPASLSIIYDTYRISSRDNEATSINGIYLKGKSLHYPQGEEAPLEFYFTAKELTHLREQAVTEITYNLCYPYATEFTTMTCIDTKTANNADDAAACKAEIYDGSRGQGGPIVVTRIEPEIMLQKDYIRPQYKIYVENLGKGYVMNKQNCDMSNVKQLFGTGYNDFSGKVTVYAELSGQRLECGPDKTGIMRLTDSESFITCSLPKEAGTFSRTKKNYLTSLSIKISYSYVLFEKQQLEIVRNDLLEAPVTQGLCNSYQVEYGGKCVDLCVYCSQNPGGSRCLENSLSTISFRPGLSCACNLAQCNEKEQKGGCIKGNFCASGVYCCSQALECPAPKIEYNGQCMNLCDYCASYNQDSQTDPRCKYTEAAQTRSISSSFSCQCVYDELSGVTDFISDQSYCDANSGKFCCAR